MPVSVFFKPMATQTTGMFWYQKMKMLYSGAISLSVRSSQWLTLVWSSAGKEYEVSCLAAPVEP
jgi:hypothetical protein